MAATYPPGPVRQVKQQRKQFRRREVRCGQSRRMFEEWRETRGVQNSRCSKVDGESQLNIPRAPSCPSRALSSADRSATAEDPTNFAMKRRASSCSVGMSERREWINELTSTNDNHVVRVRSCGEPTSERGSDARRGTSERLQESESGGQLWTSSVALQLLTRAEERRASIVKRWSGKQRAANSSESGRAPATSFAVHLDSSVRL